MGEVLDGSIVKSDSQGVRLTLGFFDEVHTVAAQAQATLFSQLHLSRPLLRRRCASGIGS